MYLLTAHTNEYHLKNSEDDTLGILWYKKKTYREALLQINNDLITIQSSMVLLNTIATLNNNNQIITAKAGMGNSVTLNLHTLNKQYFFKKTGLWKLRFIVTNINGEELFALLPTLSWTKKTHDYKLQLNEEYNAEITPLLILYALHCSNCSLTMMNGLINVI
jgi:hypothetical protein